MLANLHACRSEPLPLLLPKEWRGDATAVLGPRAAQGVPMQFHFCSLHTILKIFIVHHQPFEPSRPLGSRRGQRLLLLLLWGHEHGVLASARQLVVLPCITGGTPKFVRLEARGLPATAACRGLGERGAFSASTGGRCCSFAGERTDLRSL